MSETFTLDVAVGDETEKFVIEKSRFSARGDVFIAFEDGGAGWISNHDATAAALALLHLSGAGDVDPRIDDAMSTLAEVVGSLATLHRNESGEPAGKALYEGSSPGRAANQPWDTLNVDTKAHWIGIALAAKEIFGAEA